MQSRIYRFEIVRALANAIFEARDPANGASVFLYEWTPAIADRDAAKRRLEELGDELRVEVFTADASLYLATPSRVLGEEALERLRANGLFTGAWLSEAKPAAVESLPPLTPPPPPRPEPSRNSGPPQKVGGKGRFAVGLLLLSAASVVLGVILGTRLTPQKVAPSPVVINPSPTAAQSLENRRLQKRLSEVEANERNAQEAMKLYASTYLLRVRNGCSTPIRTAVLYTAQNSQRVVQGWMQIGPGGTSVVASSISPQFLLYAVAGSGEVWGNSAQTFDVVSPDFIYSVPAGLSEEGKRRVDALLVRSDSPAKVVNLTCSTGGAHKVQE